MENKGFAITSSLLVYTAIVALVVGVASTFFLEDDNYIEEASESMAEKFLKLPDGSIDLTPDTKE